MLLNKSNIFQIGFVNPEKLIFQSWDMMPISFLHYLFRTNIWGIDETIHIQTAIYPERKGQVFKSALNFADLYPHAFQIPKRNFQSLGLK